MAEGASGGLIFGSIIALGFALFFIGYLFYIGYKMLGNTRNALVARPGVRKYNPDDYWDDAGDGSGVNYVEMPDGSVRID